MLNELAGNKPANTQNTRNSTVFPKMRDTRVSEGIKLTALHTIPKAFQVTPLLAACAHLGDYYFVGSQGFAHLPPRCNLKSFGYIAKIIENLAIYKFRLQMVDIRKRGQSHRNLQFISYT